MRIRIALILLTLIALSGCGIQDSWSMLKSRRAFKQANLAYASRDYEKAIDFYNLTLELDKNPDPRVLVTSVFYRGSSHHLIYRPGRFDDPENEDHLDAGITDYEEAIELAREHGKEFEIFAEQLDIAAKELGKIDAKVKSTLPDFAYEALG